VKYVEFCAGIGGTRAGLDAAGWECVLAVDHDPDAVLVHRLAHGAAVERDVTKISAEEVPQADIWVAGFPCQPFSSSGNKLGFGHKSGNVFEHIARLASECQPAILVLENVEGLLTNKSGHTFATIVRTLTALGYEVDWLVVDLRWYGVPQSRPRLFVIGAKRGVLQVGTLSEHSELLPGPDETVSSVFTDYITRRKIRWSLRSQGKISDVIERMRPEIGKAQHLGRHPFSGFGHASGDDYISYNLKSPKTETTLGSLAAIVAPDFPNPHVIRSVRYYARGRGTHVHTRSEAISHCVGTSLGGAPLFAVPIATVKTDQQRKAFLRYSNWHREQDGLLVMRLSPERTALLFGPHTASISEAIGNWDAGATRKYKLVGNMVAPVCAEAIARIVRDKATVDAALRRHGSCR